MGKQKLKDTDGDGVVDSEDCQPKNTMRQDMISTLGATRIKTIANKYPTTQSADTVKRMTDKKYRKGKIY